ncbi:hypothetical protein [Rhodococcus kronopolitis]|uniref:Phage integrase family protein n=1 Tax=Rhodococcus kronopolitis TaxID=1460226 RepID=A0ABV9FY84_9NOCA
MHAVRRAGWSTIRLHDAWHTCAMRLRGVSTAVIAAWLGHPLAALILAKYAHSQDPALVAFASSAPVVKFRDNQGT